MLAAPAGVVHPLDQRRHGFGDVCRSGGIELLSRPVAPTDRHSRYPLRARGEHVLGAIADHHGLIPVATGDFCSAAPTRAALSHERSPSAGPCTKSKNRAIVEVVDDSTGGYCRFGGHDLKVVAALLKHVERLGDPGKQRIFEDADVVESCPVRGHRPIEDSDVRRAQHGLEDRRQRRANHAQETFVRDLLESELAERVVDAANNAWRRIGERAVEVEEQMHGCFLTRSERQVSNGCRLRSDGLDGWCRHSSGSATATAPLRGLGRGLRDTGRLAYGSQSEPGHCRRRQKPRPRTKRFSERNRADS